ncbi:MAG: heparinase II/III family protein [Candidatus Kapabacteria bacterium]|nr:heparinase II/III family protein [Candidatus Kapabacteria bacterium]
MNELRLYQLRTLPLSVSVRKIFRRLARPLTKAYHRQRSQRTCPYSTAQQLPWSGTWKLPSILQPPSSTLLDEYAQQLSQLAQHCIEGRWNVLGCGWIAPHYGIDVPGFEQYRYSSEPIPSSSLQGGQWLATELPPAALPRAQWLWNMIEQPHMPIDWQRDFRSGYRWNTHQWFGDIRLDAAEGADPKVPWELGRLQLLPLLALEAWRSSSDPYRRTIMCTIENHLLDFAAQNPPGYGIQWASPMDVAIRLATILVTLDLCQQLGLRRSVLDAMLLYAFDHFKFVASNLEWSEGMRANHYLACIGGLAIAAAYFPLSRWTSSLRRWCTAQLIQEAAYQFLPDGGNFEASLAYHRLSAEILGWSTWFLGQTEEGAALVHNKAFAQHFRVIAEFTQQTIYRSGDAPQIGDNDSGRFLWLLPLVENNALPHAWVHEPDPYCSQRSHLECCRLLAGVISSQVPDLARIYTDNSREHREYYCAPHFGLAVARSERAEVFVRAGSIGQRGKGGHAHNDQLSLTFTFDGQEILCDPGTYVYLPSAKWRNHFRSTRMHNTLCYEDVEQNKWASGGSEALFWLTTDRAYARIVAASQDNIVAEHYAYGIPHRRIVELLPDALLITDYFPAPSKAILYFHLHPLVNAECHGAAIVLHAQNIKITCTTQTGNITIKDSYYSHSYGVCTRTTALAVHPSQSCIRTEFHW